MPFIDSTTGPHAFEGLGGARYFDMDVEITAAGTTVSTGGKQEGLDPIIGLRYIWQISEKWRLSLNRLATLETRGLPWWISSSGRGL